ncbi:SDR family NAD(P)-dependent oxidoreductase [bacterium]|nr:SDR family NAD(P)-dependent oxidoreductase [bacterium]
MRRLQRWFLRQLRTLERLKMDFYRNKLVLVTGGSSGIGLALARQVLLNGGHVAILARHVDVLASAVEELSKSKLHHDQKVFALSADVSKKEDVEKALLDFVNANRLPDMVFNSAGVAHPGRFEELGDDIFHWMMDVNYFGIVNVLKVLVPLMQQHKNGVIVNISSIAGFIGVYGYTAYGASKFAVSGLSDALRSELKPDGIQVSIVFPPDTDTPQLTYESQFKPAVTKEIAGSAKLLDPNVVAAETLKAVARKQYIVLPGSEGKLMYWLHHFVGRLLYPIMDMMVDSALKKSKK